MPGKIKAALRWSRTGADRSLSRVVNQKAIIDTICQSDGISRAQLAHELGISKPAVASNVENLISLDLIEEKGEGEAAKSGGRKPVMLYLNKHCNYVGALDLSFLEPVCAVANLKNEIVGIKRITVSRKSSEEQRRQGVRDAFASILDENHIPAEKIGVIVISSPGLIKDESGMYYTESRHHAWTEIGIDRFLATEFGTKVSIKNDVNLAAIGELNFGVDEAPDNMLYVSCGVGLGLGIIINRELYDGERSGAGEIASLQMESGQRLEDFIAMEGLIKRVNAGLKEKGGVEEADFSQIVRLAEENDPTVEEIVYETGRHLGRNIYNCCTVLDIDTVIFGGDYLALGQPLFNGMKDSLKQTDVIKPRLIISQLNQIAGIYGCFVLGKEKIINGLVSK